jgi:hypothetical protein
MLVGPLLGLAEAVLTLDLDVVETVFEGVPCSSDVDLFGYGESVIDLNVEVAHCVLNLLVPQ